jgi:hypothetical protein
VLWRAHNRSLWLCDLDIATDLRENAVQFILPERIAHKSSVGLFWAANRDSVALTVCILTRDNAVHRLAFSVPQDPGDGCRRGRLFSRAL